MNNIRDFLVAVFSSETSTQKRLNGEINLNTQKDEDWNRLSFVKGEAAKLFSEKYIDEAKVKYYGRLGTPNRRYLQVYYFAFLDIPTKQTIKAGTYPVYLLSEDHNTILFCLAVGVSDYTADEIKEKVKAAREHIHTERFIMESPGEFKLGGGDLAKKYIPSIICYKEYSAQSIPDNSELEEDFANMMGVYNHYLDAERKNEIGMQTSEEKRKSAKEKGKKKLRYSTRDMLSMIERSIRITGFSFDDRMVEDFYLCLKSKPFVILAGTSGTGKTKLVKLFAEAIGAEYELIPVRPDWSDSSDLLGHTDLRGHFIEGDLLKEIKKAINNPKKIHFVCLDEMNLARVEYYLSDFLSVVETREGKEDKIVTIPLKIDEAAGKAYSNLYLPDNLYIVGTVNMDETTFPFSKKVLDRANTIEFSEVNLIPDFSSSSANADENLTLDNGFLKTKYLVLKNDVKDDQKEFATELCKELQEINEILEKTNSHVGYRVRDEIVFYMLNNDEAQLLSRDEAFDFEIMQKILPRIQGSSNGVKDLLIELFRAFAGEFTTGSSDMIWKQMKTYIDSGKKCKYPKSVLKICYMMRRFEEDGFTSYWI